MSPVLVINPNPETMLTRFLNIEGKTTCIRDIHSRLPQHPSAFIA